MVINARLYKKARLVFFLVSPRHFDFFNCKAKTSKCFKCELKCLDIIYRKKKNIPAL